MTLITLFPPTLRFHALYWTCIDLYKNEEKKDQ